MARSSLCPKRGRRQYGPLVHRPTPARSAPDALRRTCVVHRVEPPAAVRSVSAHAVAERRAAHRDRAFRGADRGTGRTRCPARFRLTRASLRTSGGTRDLSSATVDMRIVDPLVGSQRTRSSWKGDIGRGCGTTVAPGSVATRAASARAETVVAFLRSGERRWRQRIHASA